MSEQSTERDPWGQVRNQPRDLAQTSQQWQAAVDLTEKTVLAEYHSGRLNGDNRIREGFKNLRAALSNTSTAGASPP